MCDPAFLARLLDEARAELSTATAAFEPALLERMAPARTDALLQLWIITGKLQVIANEMRQAA